MIVKQGGRFSVLSHVTLLGFGVPASAFISYFYFPNSIFLQRMGQRKVQCTKKEKSPKRTKKTLKEGLLKKLETGNEVLKERKNQYAKENEVGKKIP